MPDAEQHGGRDHRNVGSKSETAGKREGGTRAFFWFLAEILGNTHANEHAHRTRRETTYGCQNEDMTLVNLNG